MPENLGLFQSLLKNVWALLTVFVLLALSGVSITFIVERFLRYKAATINLNNFFKKLRSILIKEGKFDRTALPHAVELCRESQSPVAAIARAAFENYPSTREETEEAMQRAAIEEIQNLEKHTVIIGTIGNVSLYIGLLGTVIGVTEAFMKLADQGGSGGVGVVGPGIAQALIATIVGLFVAIPSVAAYNLFAKKIEDFTVEMTVRSTEILNLLEPKDPERFKKQELQKEARG
jgi:biopolymer transport protein ExbB